MSQDTGKISDGSHTFDELYEHRHALFIALCYERQENTKVWRSKLHSDGSFLPGWFVLGLGKQKGYQITYHLPLSKWEITNFAETLERAPEYDGHSSQDVLERLSWF